MKQVLYITYDGLTDALGQSQILPYIIGLSKKGYRFSVISCEKPEKFESGKTYIQEICDEHAIDWHPLPYRKKPPVISTIRDVQTIKKKAFALNEQKKFSLVHCRSYISALVGLELKRKKYVPFVFDMRGFWADERVDGKLWDLSNPIYKLVYKYFKSKEAAFAQYSNAIVSLTEAGKKLMLEWPTLKHLNKITVIPCSVDMDLFDRNALNGEKLQSIKNEIGSDMVIGYYGSLGTWYMLNEMLDQFKEIKKQYPKATFLMVSNDDWTKAMDQLLEKKQIEKSSIHITRAKRADMPYYIAATQVALFFIQPCFSKLSSSPTKHAEIMSMGIPLITNSGVGDLDQIIMSTHSGTIVKQFNEENYQMAAESISALLNTDPLHIRNECKKYYALDTAVKKYADIYHLIG